MPRLYQLTVLILVIALSSCSAETNPASYMAHPEGANTFENYLFEAQRAVDSGDYDRAIELAGTAYSIDSGSERAALILSLSYLSKVGVSPFELAKALISDSEGEKDSSSQSQNPLGSLTKLIGLEEEEINQMTLENNETIASDGSVLKGAPSEGVFKDYPVLFPKSAIEARISGGEAIKLINQSIALLCPFVSESAKVMEPVADIRHTYEVCPPADKVIEDPNKAHFLWSMAHLTEATAFNSIVLYDPSGEGANLLRRSDAISDPSAIGLVEYLAAITELTETIGIIFPAASNPVNPSMLEAMVSDLKAADQGFALLSGMPESMTVSIRSTLEKIEEQQAKIQEANGDTDAADAQNQAFQESLTGSVSENIKNQIEQRSADGSLSESDKSSLCSTYSTISSDAIEACQEGS